MPSSRFMHVVQSEMILRTSIILTGRIVSIPVLNHMDKFTKTSLRFCTAGFFFREEVVIYNEVICSMLYLYQLAFLQWGILM